MNELIKEFAENAGFDISKTNLVIVRHSNGSWVGITESLEEFAELIIRKCAKVADLAHENKCESIGGNILTYFGVKE